MVAVDQVRNVLHAVAGLLVWPVLVGLLALSAAMIVTLGAAAREGWDRLRGRRRSLNRDKRLIDAVVAKRTSDTDLHIEEILQRAERHRWRSLTRLRLAVRVGPSLGLMGTLIPMANALQGLADGNLPALASNMVTAFAATVIGLSISVTAYLVAALRETWVRADTEELVFYAERLARGESAERVVA